MNGSSRVWNEPRKMPRHMSEVPITVVSRGPSALFSRAPIGSPRLSERSANGKTCTASGTAPAAPASPLKKRRLSGAYDRKLPKQ